MRMKVQVIVESDAGNAEAVREAAKLDRGVLRPEALGPSLSEAKALLQQLQEVMVNHQIAQYVSQQAPCPECGKRRSRKGEHQIVFRTLFGKLRLHSPRLYACGCCDGGGAVLAHSQ